MTRYHHARASEEEGSAIVIETMETTSIVKLDEEEEHPLSISSNHGGDADLLAELRNQQPAAPGKLTGTVIMVALIAASGGLLFGYDLGITGGVVANQYFLATFFPHVAAARAKDAGDESVSTSPYCHYADPGIQLFTSSLFLAGAFSAACAGWFTNKYGRKWTMMVGGGLFVIGTIFLTGATGLGVLIMGRVILGLGVGFANQATPLYLSEMAPSQLRGALNVLFQLATTLGILAAQLINYGTQHIASNASWRISLGLAGVPGILLLTGSLFLPDTPHSLLFRGKGDEAKAVLERIRGSTGDDVAVEFHAISCSITESSSQQGTFVIFERQYRPQLVISILIPMFQQLTGINAIMFYAPQLFEAAGQSGSDSLVSTVTIGAVNVVATLVALSLVDRLGRRWLLIQGGIQMMVCEIATGVLLLFLFAEQQNKIDGDTSPSSSVMNRAVVTFVCLFVAGFAWSWGPLAWLVPSEIHSMETRATGTAIATVCNFLLTFVIGQAFLSMLCVMEFGVFFFFAGWIVVMTVFVALLVPETKGVPAERVHGMILHEHWFWRRFADPDASIIEHYDEIIDDEDSNLRRETELL